MNTLPDHLCHAVLFDLDGTLVDSSQDLWRTMNHVLEQRGYASLAHEQVLYLVGNGARSLLARGFWGETAEPPTNDPFFEAAVLEFLAFYNDHLVDHSRPYPGVVETLTLLQNQGLRLAVATNKPEAMTRKMLHALNLTRFFGEAIVGGDTLETRKPDPLPLRHLMAQLGTTPENTIMVGDSETDILAARNAGCRVIAVTYGYSRGQSVESLHPNKIAHSFPELLTLLQ